MPAIPLSDLAMELLLQEPFFGHLLSALPRQATEAAGDLALAPGPGGMVLLVREAGLSDREQVPCLLRHELLHLVLGHPAAIRRVSQPWLFHLAADLVVNRLLAPEQRPSDAWLPEHFPELEWPQAPDTLQCYTALETAWRKYLDGQGSWPRAWVPERLADASAMKRHRYWAGISALESRLLEQQSQLLLQQTWNRSGATLPAALREWLRPETEPEVLPDWRRRLHMFLHSGRRSRLEPTFRRVSRRYGSPPGLRIRRGLRLLIAIDTSASVEPQILDQFFAEIHHLWERQGAEIGLLECDVAIRRQYRYEGRRPAYVSGRGGTLFEEPIALANRQRPAVPLLYFTDGEGPAPQIACAGPLLWVLSGKKGGHLPGEKIWLTQNISA